MKRAIKLATESKHKVSSEIRVDGNLALRCKLPRDVRFYRRSTALLSIGLTLYLIKISELIFHRPEVARADSPAK